MRLHRHIGVQIVLALAALAAAPGAAWDQPAGENPAVFFVAAVDSDGTRPLQTGTGFFIDPGGTALTASHVASVVTRDRAKRLIAVVNREAYAADVVCASRLPYDPTSSVPGLYSFHAWSRDVAAIKLRPGTDLSLPNGALSWETRDGRQVRAPAHTGALPAFPALPLGKGMRPGDAVTVVGYGAASPAMTQERIAGTVREIERARDGTRVGVLAFPERSAPGAGFSGAPAINGAGQVVGLLAWTDADTPDRGYAETSDSLTPPCGTS